MVFRSLYRRLYPSLLIPPKNKNHKPHSFLRTPPVSPSPRRAWLSPGLPTFFALNFFSYSSLSSLLNGLSTSKKDLYLAAFSLGKTFLHPPDLTKLRFTSFPLLLTLLELIFPICYTHFSFLWHSYDYG